MSSPSKSSRWWWLWRPVSLFSLSRATQNWAPISSSSRVPMWRPWKGQVHARWIHWTALTLPQSNMSMNATMSQQMNKDTHTHKKNFHTIQRGPGRPEYVVIKKKKNWKSRISAVIEWVRHLHEKRQDISGEKRKCGNGTLAPPGGNFKIYSCITSINILRKVMISCQSGITMFLCTVHITHLLYICPGHTRRACSPWCSCVVLQSLSTQQHELLTL